MRRSASPKAATGASGAEAVASMPGGAAVMQSPWLIQTSADAGQSLNSGEGPVSSSLVRPYSPRPVRVTVPPSWRATSWAP